MRILLLGASGFIGKTIFSSLKKDGFELYGTYCSHCPKPFGGEQWVFFDINSPRTIFDLLQTIQPDIIISSLTGNFSNQLQVHENIVSYLTKNKNCKIIFISTANVFDNDISRPHTENDVPNAESEYGLYKTACEEMLKKHLKERAIIIRIPCVWDNNCPRIHQLLDCAKNEKPLQMWDSLMINYTTPQQISTWISYIITHDLKGIFHIGTTDMMSYWEFYKKIIDTMQLSIAPPKLAVEHLPNTYYQAVLSNRTDIPGELQLTVHDVLEHCCQ